MDLPARILSSVARRWKKSPSEDEVSEVGRCTWKLLHSIARYYPDKPLPREEQAVHGLIDSLSVLYPCGSCRAMLRWVSEKRLVQARSRQALEESLCHVHNLVNLKLSKKVVPCLPEGRAHLIDLFNWPAG